MRAAAAAETLTESIEDEEMADELEERIVARLKEEFRAVLKTELATKFTSLGIDCSTPENTVKIQRKMSILMSFAEGIDNLAWRIGWGIIWLAICGLGYLAIIGWQNPLHIKLP